MGAGAEMAEASVADAGEPRHAAEDELVKADAIVKLAPVAVAHHGTHRAVSLKNHVKRPKQTPQEMAAELLRACPVMPEVSVAFGIASMLRERSRKKRPSLGQSVRSSESVLAAEIMSKVRKHANLPPIPPESPKPTRAEGPPGRPLPVLPQLTKRATELILPEFKPPPTGMYVGLKPNERIGDYIVTRRIAKGSMSAIIEATHRITDLKVALKIVRKQYEGASDNTGACDANYDVNRFAHALVREASVLRRLQGHPCIVKIYEVVERDDVVALAMELIGPDYRRLTDRIASGGALSESVCRRIMRQLISAVAYIHEQHILHKDITPNNVMICDEGNYIKLIDFGRAVSFSPSRSLDNGGNAPVEPISGKKTVGPEVDLWGCGVCLHAMASGAVCSVDEVLIGSHAHAFNANASKGTRIPGVRFEMPATCTAELKSFLGVLTDVAFARKMRLRTIDDFFEHPWLVGSDPLGRSTTSVELVPAAAPPARHVSIIPSIAETRAPTTQPPAAAQPQQARTPAVEVPNAEDTGGGMKVLRYDLFPQLNLMPPGKEQARAQSPHRPSKDATLKLPGIPGAKEAGEVHGRPSIFTSIVNALDQPGALDRAKAAVPQAAPVTAVASEQSPPHSDKVMSSRAQIVQASFAAAAASAAAAATRKQWLAGRVTLGHPTQATAEEIARQRREKEAEELRQVHRWAQRRMLQLGFPADIVSRVADSLGAMPMRRTAGEDNDSPWESEVDLTAEGPTEAKRKVQPELDSAAATYRLLFDSKLSEKKAATRRRNSIVDFTSRLAAVRERRKQMALSSTMAEREEARAKKRW